MRNERNKAMNRDRYFHEIFKATITIRPYGEQEKGKIIGETYNEQKARKARKMAKLFGDTLRELIAESEEPDFYDRILLDKNRSLKDLKDRMRTHILSQGYFDEEQRRFVFNDKIVEPIADVWFYSYHILTPLYSYTQDPDVWSFKKKAVLQEGAPEYILMGANLNNIRRLRMPRTVSAKGGRGRIEEANGRAILIKADDTKLINYETGEEVTMKGEGK